MRMTTNAACLCVAIVIVSGAGCASGGGVIRQSSEGPALVGEAAVTPAPAARKRITRIVVTGNSGDCRATIDDYKIVGKRNKKIAWLVEDQSNGCGANEKWHIQLEFTTAWNHGRDKFVNIHPDDLTILRVHPNTPETKPGAPHVYKVYLVYPKLFGPDIRIPLIDPELDIEI